MRWDYDTEDSGVDSSVSSMEMATHGLVEYAAVIVNNKMNRKSFLHSAYLPSDASDPPQCKSPCKVTIPAAKNSFLHSLLQVEQTSEDLATSVQVQQCVSDRDSFLLIAQGGSSVRMKVKSATGSATSSAVLPKNSFSRNRIQRNSARRLSWRHLSSDLAEGVHLASIADESGLIRKKTHRRLPSSSASRKCVKSPMAASQVATLASKFNLLISQSLDSGSGSGSGSSSGSGSFSKVHASASKNSGPCAVKRRPVSKPSVNTTAQVKLEIPESWKLVLPEAACVDPARSTVYGTVKSIVKNAIRKFEKLEDGKQCDAVTAPEASSAQVLPPLLPLLPESKLPDVIAPNTSFLWRNSNILNSSGSSGDLPEVYYEMGNGNTYDTLRSAQAAGSPTSSSSSSNGYDEISFRRRASDGYILPGHPDSLSSSALGYERILPPPRVEKHFHEDDGQTLRYEQCGAAILPATSKGNLILSI